MFKPLNFSILSFVILSWVLFAVIVKVLQKVTVLLIVEEIIVWSNGRKSVVE